MITIYIKDYQTVCVHLMNEMKIKWKDLFSSVPDFYADLNGELHCWSHSIV